MVSLDTTIRSYPTLKVARRGNAKFREGRRAGAFRAWLDDLIPSAGSIPAHTFPSSDAGMVLRIELEAPSCCIGRCRLAISKSH